MSGMVLNQLLNPESGIDRPGADKAPAGVGQGRPDNGPSRYDEVVRQQEKRLEQRRAEERAAQRRREEEDIRQKQQAARTDSGESSARDRAQAAKDSRPEDDSRTRASKETEAVEENTRTANTEPTEPRKGQSTADDTEREAAAIELVEFPQVGDESGVVGFMMHGAAAERLTSAEGEATRTTAQVMASLTGNGQKSGGLPTAGKLFSAMLEAGQDNNSKQGRDLIAGLQAGNAQVLSDAGGKAADTLAAQVASRLTAPELTQPLSQAATLRGPDAQALMRSYSTSVDVPVGADEWGEKVMGKLAFLTASQMSVAEIHVTPPDLGPLEVRVQVQNDQATVTVHTTTPAVREQLELHGHRLRDMLNEQGLNLEGFDVSDSSDRGNQEQQDGDDASGAAGTGHGMAAAENHEDATAMTELDLSWKGELDIYA